MDLLFEKFRKIFPVYRDMGRTCKIQFDKAREMDLFQEDKVKELDENIKKSDLKCMKLIVQLEIQKYKSFWKTVEVDGMPEKGVYLCKVDMEGWVYLTAIILGGEFVFCHTGQPFKPNYYRLIEEGN